jgi:hypothetical protein
MPACSQCSVICMYILQAAKPVCEVFSANVLVQCMYIFSTFLVIVLIVRVAAVAQLQACRIILKYAQMITSSEAGLRGFLRRSTGTVVVCFLMIFMIMCSQCLYATVICMYILQAAKPVCEVFSANLLVQ